MIADTVAPVRRVGWMIELRRRQWIIDQTSRGLFSGEVHYFRLARRDWRSRLLDLRAAGAQAVATYIPWVVHELPDGTIDVTARTADWRDLGAFCDLAHELGLFVIARPGPYVMAELQHEGLSHRVMHCPTSARPPGTVNRCRPPTSTTCPRRSWPRSSAGTTRCCRCWPAGSGPSRWGRHRPDRLHPGGARLRRTDRAYGSHQPHARRPRGHRAGAQRRRCRSRGDAAASRVDGGLRVR